MWYYNRLKMPQLKGGRLDVSYVTDKILRVKALFSQCMQIMQPFLATPPAERDADELLSEQQREIIQENSVIIQDLLQKIQRKTRELAKNNAGFKRSSLYRIVAQIQKLYFDIYKELWGGYAYFDDIGIDAQLRAFHDFLQSINLPTATTTGSMLL